MNERRLLLPLVVLSLLALLPIQRSLATVTTFDDVPNAVAPYPYLTNGYQGLNWTNFAALNGVLEKQIHGLDGGYYGMVSPSNVVFNAFGNPAEIDARGTNFNFLSAYLTGAWNSNLNIEVQGFRDSNLVYDVTKVVSATNPTLFAFDYLDIDRLYFNSSGGQDAGFGSGGGETFVMDNFMYEFIPEPSSLLLTALGVVTLCAVLKRKRA
jgi:hypothetical protein